MQKITTHLWFDNKAEEATAFYTSIFDDSRILEVQRFPGTGQDRASTAVVVTFELAGQRFIALDGGPEFKFTDAISLYVDCATQEEIDSLWAKLTADGGEDGPCGWLKDKYGLSWQLVPRVLTDLLTDADPEVSSRVTKAMLGMRKLDVEGLLAAAKG